MDKKIIIHIPHASLKLPNIFYQRILIDKEQLEKENIFVSDYLVNKLISNQTKNIIKFNYSRLFCDVERFKDDDLEIMSKVGMGAIYEKDSNGNNFIKYDLKYKNLVLTKYYDKYHDDINQKVDNLLNKYGGCYIIDLHSFSNKFVKKILKLDNCPDICIGYDEDFKDDHLIDITIKHFRKYGYDVKTNYPYNGSFIPNNYFQTKDPRIKSIMIEINKKIYLDNNETINEKNFNYLSKCMNKYFKIISKY